MAIKKEYPWLNHPAYKDYEVWENEDFLYIKRKGIPVDVYISSSKNLTEGFLERKIKGLYLEDQNEVRRKRCEKSGGKKDEK